MNKYKGRNVKKSRLFLSLSEKYNDSIILSNDSTINYFYFLIHKIIKKIY